MYTTSINSRCRSTQRVNNPRPNPTAIVRNTNGRLIIVLLGMSKPEQGAAQSLHETPMETRREGVPRGPKMAESRPKQTDVSQNLIIRRSKLFR